MGKAWFDGKTVVVTGASSGIGEGIAKKLINEHGCKVIGVARNVEKLTSLKESFADKDSFSFYTFDVSERESWENFALSLKQENIIPDMVINNAGILPKFDRFTNYSIEEIEKAMQINFYSSVYSMKALMPAVMKSPTPAFVNVASSAALCSLAGTSVYSASKAALKSLTDAVREEVRGECYIGLVCPGFTKTNIFRGQGITSTSKAQKAMDFVSTDCDRMVNLIIRGIKNKRSDMVFGVDAHLMSLGNKLFGTACSNISSKVMKISGLPLFKNIFDKN